MAQTILVADDDEMIVDALRYQLEQEGYTVLTAHDGGEALRMARSQNPDLVLLDVMMPVLQGWDVCRQLRQESTVPILMLTARGEELDRVLGLELGADDYIVKPFSFRELLARIHAHLRRSGYVQSAGVESGETVRIGSLVVDQGKHVVSVRGAPVTLSPREYDVLLALIEAHGAVVKRDDLLDRVWGKTWVGDPRTVDVHVRWLREKLETDASDPRLILTVRGVGYRLVSPEELKSNGQ